MPGAVCIPRQAGIFLIKAANLEAISFLSGLSCAGPLEHLPAGVWGCGTCHQAGTPPCPGWLYPPGVSRRARPAGCCPRSGTRCVLVTRTLGKPSGSNGSRARELCQPHPSVPIAAGIAPSPPAPREPHPGELPGVEREPGTQRRLCTPGSARPHLGATQPGLGDPQALVVPPKKGWGRVLGVRQQWAGTEETPEGLPGCYSRFNYNFVKLTTKRRNNGGDEEIPLGSGAG